MNWLAALQGIQPRNAMLQPVLFGGAQAQGADLDALARAQALTAGGAAAQDVFSKTAPKEGARTGWFKGADNKWRFEIDDSKAAMNPEGLARLKSGEPVRLADVLSHPDLFAAYPDAADIPVRPETGGGGMMGSYGKGEMRLALGRKVEDILGTTLHEAQHFIQEKEKFGRGGSSTGVNEILDMQDIFTRYEVAPLINLMDAWLDAPQGSEARVKARKAYEDAIATQKQLAARQTEARAKRASLDAYEIYRRLAGETEARNVQNRMLLTPAQRQASFPMGTADYPASEQFLPGYGMGYSE